MLNYVREKIWTILCENFRFMFYFMWRKFVVWLWKYYFYLKISFFFIIFFSLSDWTTWTFVSSQRRHSTFQHLLKLIAAESRFQGYESLFFIKIKLYNYDPEKKFPLIAKHKHFLLLKFCLYTNWNMYHYIIHIEYINFEPFIYYFKIKYYIIFICNLYNWNFLI